MIALLGRLFLVVGFFKIFISLNISCHSPLACKKFLLKSQLILMGVPLYTTNWLSLAAFKILFIFIPCHFNYVSWVHLIGDPVLSGPGCLFPLPGYGSFQLLFLQINSRPLSVFSFWDPYNANVRVLDVVLEVL